MCLEHCQDSCLHDLRHHHLLLLLSQAVAAQVLVLPLLLALSILAEGVLSSDLGFSQWFHCNHPCFLFLCSSFLLLCAWTVSCEKSSSKVCPLVQK